MLSDTLNIQHDAPNAEPRVEQSKANVISDSISLIQDTALPQGARSPSYSKREPGKPVHSSPPHTAKLFIIFAKSPFLFSVFNLFKIDV